MSRKDEDRILHGLHYYRESVDQDFTATSHQILWLAAHSFGEGNSWHQGEDFQSFDISVVPVDLRHKLLMSKFELPLRYLNYRRLIKLTSMRDETVQLAVTFAGADRAMRLHTRLGRLEVWYQEHKDGFLGMVTTIAVSLITALLTVYVVEHLRRVTVEPPRPAFEANPS